MKYNFKFKEEVYLREEDDNILFCIQNGIHTRRYKK